MGKAIAPVNREAMQKVRETALPFKATEIRLITSDGDSLKTQPVLIGIRNSKQVGFKYRVKGSKKKGKIFPGGTRILETPVPLFSYAKKMNCPSFSLPAGNPNIHGTCWMEGGQANSYICKWCYALKGSYLAYPKITVMQLVRHAYVEGLLATGRFVEEMSRALAHVMRKSLGSIGDDAHRFFRLHDSGDFFSPEYFHGWMEVASRFPDIQFWCPTRVWAMKEFKGILDQVPDNMVLRFSALHINESVPREEGSTVHKQDLNRAVLGRPQGKHEGHYVEINGEWVWECPAYRYHTPKDKAGSDSCEGVGNLGIQVGNNTGCRFCWVSRDRAVSYLEH